MKTTGMCGAFALSRCSRLPVVDGETALQAGDVLVVAVEGEARNGPWRPCQTP